MCGEDQVQKRIDAAQNQSADVVQSCILLPRADVKVVRPDPKCSVEIGELGAEDEHTLNQDQQLAANLEIAVRLCTHSNQLDKTRHVYEKYAKHTDG